jgi:hypothetical protein
MEKKCRILKSVNYDVHTPKHTRMHQNKQGREFQILITCLGASGLLRPRTLLQSINRSPENGLDCTKFIATNKTYCPISFGAHSSCNTLLQSFAVNRATNWRHGWFWIFHQDKQKLQFSILVYSWTAICLIFTWEDNKSQLPTNACIKSTTWS